MVNGMSVVVNVMVSLMSVMGPSHALYNLSMCTAVKLCTFGSLNCYDICMCVVNNYNNICFKVQYPMYIEVRDQWTILQNAFTIINSDHNINNNNIYIVVYSKHPYCCENTIVLTLFLKQSKLGILICSQIVHSHGAA